MYIKLCENKTAELARRVNIGRNSICDYLKGKYEAKQDKLHSLVKALNVDEGWLMGYNINQEKIAILKCQLI